MLVEAFNSTIYIVIYTVCFLSLFAIDYVLGHGFIHMSQKILCKMMCFLRRAVKEELKQVQASPEIPISFSNLFIEILALTFTIAFLNKYKQLRGKDRIDELLIESKETLRQTNEFLEKWRLRRVPTEYSYLDDEPQEIKPLKLEMPILHMAIIDTLGTTRSKLKRGDAGDAINVTDSTLLSVTSLIDDIDSMNEPPPQVVEEKVPDETKNIELRNRYLWDVMEEDADSLED